MVCDIILVEVIGYLRLVDEDMFFIQKILSWLKRWRFGGKEVAISIIKLSHGTNFNITNYL